MAKDERSDGGGVEEEAMAGSRWSYMKWSVETASLQAAADSSASLRGECFGKSLTPEDARTPCAKICTKRAATLNKTLLRYRAPAAPRLA